MIRALSGYEPDSESGSPKVKKPVIETPITAATLIEQSTITDFDALKDQLSEAISIALKNNSHHNTLLNAKRYLETLQPKRHTLGTFTNGDKLRMLLLAQQLVDKNLIAPGIFIPTLPDFSFMIKTAIGFNIDVTSALNQPMPYSTQAYYAAETAAQIIKKGVDYVVGTASTCYGSLFAATPSDKRDITESSDEGSQDKLRVA